MKTRITNVSVVIPLYNKEKYIKRAVNSVRSQTHQSFELIIVNDGSTDNSMMKVREITDGRVRIIEQDNSGESAARNKGIAEAKYDLIAFLDADDQWEPECLENLVNVAEAYPEAGMIGAAATIIKTGKEIIYPEFKYVPEEEGIIENYFKAALERHPICASAVVIRKEVFYKLGGFKVGMRYGPDTLMWAKIALNYPVAFVNKFLAIRYKNADNRVSMDYGLVDDLTLFEYINSLDKEIEEEKYYYIREYVYKHKLSLAKRCIRIGDKKKAKQFISQAKATKLYRHTYIRRKKDLYLSYPMINSLAGIWRKIKRIYFQV